MTSDADQFDLVHNLNKGSRKYLSDRSADEKVQNEVDEDEQVLFIDHPVPRRLVSNKPSSIELEFSPHNNQPITNPHNS